MVEGDEKYAGFLFKKEIKCFVALLSRKPTLIMQLIRKQSHYFLYV